MKNDFMAAKKSGNQQPQSSGPWENDTLSQLREWDPVWIDQCLKMSNDPWVGGVLPRKDVELISIAVNAACTNLSDEGTRRHIRGALEAGATLEEIMMIIKIASLLSIHTASLGAPILLEEAKAVGVKLATKKPASTPVCDQMKAAGQWNTAWDGFYEIDQARHRAGDHCQFAQAFLIYWTPQFSVVINFVVMFIYKIVILLLAFTLTSQLQAQSPNVSFADPVFKKHTLDPVFVSEGVAVADINNDGKTDVLAGPFWYEAPQWKKHRIHADTLNPVPGYSTSFINFSLDVNNDGWIDFISFDQPGAACTWYENPKNKEEIWKGTVILATAGIESPAFVDVDGDGKKDIICNDITLKQVIWLKSPSAINDTLWQRFVISRDPGIATNRYTHGLGWGDINRDGRNDVIIKTGWWESPVNVKEADWKFHEASLGEDCANMYVVDADGDGDTDVVSSSAHKYGVWWYEQTSSGWITHEISKLFSQSHALALKDINGDGHPDLISGKRYLAHIEGDPGTHDPSVLYWYEFVPDKNPQWIPHLVDDDSGIGNNFEVQDINNDKLPDIVISNKKGVFFFEQVKSR